MSQGVKDYKQSKYLLWTFIDGALNFKLFSKIFKDSFIVFDKTRHTKVDFEGIQWIKITNFS